MDIVSWVVDSESWCIGVWGWSEDVGIRCCLDVDIVERECYVG